MTVGQWTTHTENTCTPADHIRSCRTGWFCSHFVVISPLKSVYLLCIHSRFSIDCVSLSCSVWSACSDTWLFFMLITKYILAENKNFVGLMRNAVDLAECSAWTVVGDIIGPWFTDDRLRVRQLLLLEYNRRNGQMCKPCHTCHCSNWFQVTFCCSD